MARDYDAQLLEAVKVRRRRLTDAFLRGRLASRRPVTDNLRRLVLAVVVAAVVCAICAGVSFVQAHRHDSTSLRARLAVPTAATPGARV